jgi:hypothetical protein
MAELEWLDTYEGETIDGLLSLEGEYRTDSLILALEARIGQKAASSGDESLSEEEQTVLAIEAFEREVNNGGYDQFFVNCPEYAPSVIAALRRIGCSGIAEITSTAVAALGISGPLTADAVSEAVQTDDDARTEVLSNCDQEFYGANEHIAGKLFQYVKQNRGGINLS